MQTAMVQANSVVKLEAHAVPTLAVSPWKIIRSFPLLSQVRLMWSSLRFMLQPERTEELFKVAALFMKHEVEGHRPISDFVEQIVTSPSVRMLYQARYLPPPANLQELIELPVGTLGHTYAKHMLDHGLDVVFYPEFEVKDALTWLEMRARQTHDILHVVTGFDTSIAHELGLQAFTAAQINSPMSVGIVGGGLMHAAFLKPEISQGCLTAIHTGYAMGRSSRALLGYAFEDNWDKPLADVRRELNIVPFT